MSFGIPGSRTARKWLHQGLKSLDDIRLAVQNGTHKLSEAQQVRHSTDTLFRKFSLLYWIPASDRVEVLWRHVYACFFYQLRVGLCINRYKWPNASCRGGADFLKDQVHRWVRWSWILWIRHLTSNLPHQRSVLTPNCPSRSWEVSAGISNCSAINDRHLWYH